MLYKLPSSFFYFIIFIIFVISPNSKNFSLVALTSSPTSSPKASSITPSKPFVVPGIIQTLDNILYGSKNQFENLEKKIPSTPQTISDLHAAQKVSLNPYFLNSLFLYSDHNYLSMSFSNECSFWALIENGLLKTAKGNITHIIADIKKTDGQTVTSIVAVKDYLQYIYQQKCFKNNESKPLFNLDKIQQTFENAHFRIPKNENDCEEILYNWKKDPLTPHFCRISHDIILQQELSKKIEQEKEFIKDHNKRREYQYATAITSKLSELISESQIKYIHNVCQHIDAPAIFCAPHLSKNFWSKILNAQFPYFYLDYICQGLLSKDNIKPSNYSSCVSILEQDVSACLYNNTVRYPALSPRPSCDLIGKALENNRLKIRYQDCPGNIDNEGITTSIRLLNHLIGNDQTTTPLQCSDYPTKIFAELILNEGNRKIWNFEVCYNDPTDKSPKCFPFYWGLDDENNYAENVVIAKVVSKATGAPKDLKCSIISEEDFKPHLLSFKRGCFVTYNKNRCTSMSCNKKVYYNENEVKNVYFNQGTLFHYFPINLKDAEYAINNLIQSETPLTKREVEVKNLTEVKFHFSNSTKKIVHGIGCREDLLPQFFNKATFNACTPLSFLVTGIVTEKMKDFLVVITGMDDVYSPRIIAWNQIFSAVKNYQEIHPLNSWNLYVVSP